MAPFRFLSVVDEARNTVETLHARGDRTFGSGSCSTFVRTRDSWSPTPGWRWRQATLPSRSSRRRSSTRRGRLVSEAHPVACVPAPAGGRQQDADPVPRRTAPMDARMPHGLMVRTENAIPLNNSLESLGLDKEALTKRLPKEPEDVHRKLCSDLLGAGTDSVLTEQEETQTLSFVKRPKRGSAVRGADGRHVPEARTPLNSTLLDAAIGSDSEADIEATRTGTWMSKSGAACKSVPWAPGEPGARPV